MAGAGWRIYVRFAGRSPLPLSRPPGPLNSSSLLLGAYRPTLGRRPDPRNPMGFFDFLKPKPRPRADGKVPVQVTWTDDERRAKHDGRQEMLRLAGGGPDKELYLSPKAAAAIDAQSLQSYVDRIFDESSSSTVSADERTALLMKALQTQAKIYCLHDFPYYAFRWGLLAEMTGDVAMARRLYASYLDLQREFVPDSVDAIALRLYEELGYDAKKAEAFARAKLAIPETPEASESGN